MHRHSHLTMAHKLLFLLIVSLTEKLSSAVPLPSGTNKPCGCVELSDIAKQKINDWTTIPKEQAESSPGVHEQCDQFCHSNKHFVLQDFGEDKFLCKCYRAQLNVFDCDEEQGVKLVHVHCRSNNLTPEHGYQRNTMAMIRNGFQPRRGHALASFEAAPLVETNEKGNLLAHPHSSHHDEDSDTLVESNSKEEALGLAAMVLGIISLVCLSVLGLKTWCDHQKNLQKAQNEEPEKALPDLPQPIRSRLGADPLVYEKH